MANRTSSARLGGVRSSSYRVSDYDEEQHFSHSPRGTFDPARLTNYQYDWQRPGDRGKFQDLVRDFAQHIRQSRWVDRNLLDNFCELIRDDEEAWELAESMVPELRPGGRSEPTWGLDFYRIQEKLGRADVPILPRMVFRSEQEFLERRHARTVESLCSGWGGMLPASAETEIQERIAIIEDLTRSLRSTAVLDKKERRRGATKSYA